EIAMSTNSSSSLRFTGSARAGPFMTWPWMRPMRKSSADAMCSATWATDQRVGSCLKFNWASERPLTEARKAALVFLRWALAGLSWLRWSWARLRSAALTDSARSQAVDVTKKPIQAARRRRFMAGRGGLRANYRGGSLACPSCGRKQEPGMRGDVATKAQKAQ